MSLLLESGGWGIGMHLVCFIFLRGTPGMVAFGLCRALTSAVELPGRTVAAASPASTAARNAARSAARIRRV